LGPYFKYNRPNTAFDIWILIFDILAESTIKNMAITLRRNTIV
jgi:hypothetical protein